MGYSATEGFLQKVVWQKYIRGSDGAIVVSANWDYVELIVKGKQKVTFKCGGATPGYAFYDKNGGVIESQPANTPGESPLVFDLNVPENAYILRYSMFTYGQNPIYTKIYGNPQNILNNYSPMNGNNEREVN